MPQADASHTTMMPLALLLDESRAVGRAISAMTSAGPQYDALLERDFALDRLIRSTRAATVPELARRLRLLTDALEEEGLSEWLMGVATACRLDAEHLARGNA